MITKLNKLNNPESFLQINIVKGFKYIDLAGEIVNQYHKKDTPPKFRMGLEGLVIENPLNYIDLLKVTPTIIWGKFSNNPSFDSILKIFNEQANNILQILKVDKINRIGWRNYFIYEVNQNKLDEYFKKYFQPNTLKITSYTSELVTNKDFKANLTVVPVVKNDSGSTKGLLFDVDIFQTGNFTPDQINQILKNFREFLSNKGEFINILNTTFL